MKNLMMAAAAAVLAFGAFGKDEFRHLFRCAYRRG